MSKITEFMGGRKLSDFVIEKVGVDDIREFYEFIMENVSERLVMPGCVDVCGTGGSGFDRINTSTIASFILAACGVGVAKHGNKASSGRFGSFDLLERMGIDIEKDKADLERDYMEHGLSFIYARSFHPIMKHFAEERVRLGVPTIFNILGPLLNPAGVKTQIIGCSFKDQMRLIAEACRSIGKERVMVVRGRDGLDEITITGETDVVELMNGEIREYVLSPSDFGVSVCDFGEISGSGEDFCERIAYEILKGECKSRHADLVFVNCAAVLKLCGVVKSFNDGYEMAKSVVGFKKFAEMKGGILHRISVDKLVRRSSRSFYDALKKKGLGVIAEIKKSSPSGGVIFNGKFSAGDIARVYEGNGAVAISVLTDARYFNGDFAYLREVKDSTVSVPVLCKDFILYEYQIYKAREFGADAVLLIAGLLGRDELARFVGVAESLGMDALVEVHDEVEMKKALGAGARIVGINNRDLKTFKVDLGVTERLAGSVPSDVLVVSESGIKSGDDVRSLGGRVDAVLVGTALMSAKNIKSKLNEITS
ncbi:MAG: anthranilate phosphoribosyltransferase [Candidatus Peregrinibacteria bacterium]